MQFFDAGRLLTGFVVFCAIFLPLEQLLPIHRHTIFRAGFLTDIVHFFISGGLRKLLTGVLGFFVIQGLSFFINPTLQAAVLAQPGWLQFIEAVLLQELGAYNGHRLAHKIPWLWRFHAIHHSSEHMDWLAANRVHPVDQTLIRIWGFIPLYLLGFSKETFGILLGIEVFIALFIHSNIRVRFGWLERIITTPAFHHWHHTNDDPAYYDKNFAGMLPLMDLLFGTYYLPDHFPETYGINEPVASSYVGQMMQPFLPQQQPDQTATNAAITEHHG